MIFGAPSTPLLFLEIVPERKCSTAGRAATSRRAVVGVMAMLRQLCGVAERLYRPKGLRGLPI